MSSKQLFRAAVAMMVTVPAFGTAQAPGRDTPPLPPMSYVCPMPADAAVVEDRPGACPKCGMTLQPVRLVSKWWCPVHQLLEVHDAVGQCRRDGRALVPVTLSEFWTCPGEPSHALEPGRCASGGGRQIGYELRAHGDHNPRHGGQFFMAEDQWHHLEGAYPQAGLFRAFFYDNFTKPIAARPFSGAVIVLDQMDREIATYPLKPGKVSNTLEARIPGVALPLKAAARVKFDPAGKVQRFDFTFAEYSKEPASIVTTRSPSRTAAPGATTARAATSAPVPTTATVAPVVAAPPAPSNVVDISQIPAALADALDETALPASTAGLVSELAARTKRIQQVVADGNLGLVWLPAMATKTVALALDSHAADLPVNQRPAAASAVKRVVTAAWELDAYGDLGNREQIDGASERLAAAVSELNTIFAGARQP